MSPAEIIARQVMLHDTCGCTVNGKHVTCDSPALDGLLDPYGEPMRWDECRCNDRASSILAALEAEGFVVVPVEPTPEMLTAGWRESVSPATTRGHAVLTDYADEYAAKASPAYRAMLAARPR